MAYIVQADRPGSGPATLTLADREEALKTAVRWADGGCSHVRIIGDGRIYSPEELAVAIING